VWFDNFYQGDKVGKDEFTIVVFPGSLGAPKKLRLPKRFVKIRRYGIYNHTTKRNLNLQFVPQEKPDIDTIIKQKETATETSLQRFERLTGVNPCLCPVCKTGRMVTIRELPRIRSPALLLSEQTPTQD